MPRQLEIRTTILAKGADYRRKDARADENYAAEALQLLDEIQRLKANLVKTDKKILGTYKKPPPEKKKAPLVTEDVQRKTETYRVFYPAVGDRDEVASRCLNSAALSAPSAFTAAAGGLVGFGGASCGALPDGVPAPSVPSDEKSRPLDEQRRYGQRCATAETLGEAEQPAPPLDVADDEPGENGPSHAPTETHPTGPASTAAAAATSAAAPVSGFDGDGPGDDDDVDDGKVADKSDAVAVEESAGPNLDDDDDDVVDERNEPEPVAPRDEPEQVPFVPHLADSPPVDDERRENRAPKERSKHYDRTEIRRYIEKQKKERKEKHGDRHLVCHHKRPAPMTRAEMGLASNVAVARRATGPSPLKKSSKAPDAEAVQPERRRRQEDWGPYDEPNFTATFTVPDRHETDDEKSRKKRRALEKSIQTDEAGKVDESTQITARKLDESASNWLYSVPSSSRKAAGRASPREKLRTARSTSVSSVIGSSSSTSFDERQVGELERGPLPAPVGHLIAHIENLEHYLGNLLETAVPVAAPLQLPAVPFLTSPYAIERPPTIPAKPGPTCYRPDVPSGTFTLPDGRLPLRASIPPHSVPAQPASQKAKSRPKLDETSTSTQYRPLPDRFGEYVRLAHRPAELSSSSSSSSSSLVKSKPVVGKEQAKRLEHGDWSCIFASQPKVAEAAQQQQTYFRDFNEILRTDPAPTVKSNSWKRLGGSSSKRQVLAALSDEIRQTMDRISRPNTSDSDLQSHLSVSSASSARAEGWRSADARRRALAALTDELKETLGKIPQRSTRHESGFQSKLSQQSATSDSTPAPKNGPGSRSAARDSGSRTGKSSDRSSSRRTVVAMHERDDSSSESPVFDETTFVTLTPQTASFEASAAIATAAAAERKAPFDSTADADKALADNNSIFSATFSPIPRAVSPLSLVSESERSVGEQLERKQSTSSSERSEHDRSVGEKLVDVTSRRTAASPRHRDDSGANQVANAIKKSDDLLARLRSELIRDESLFRSLQHVDKLEKAAAAAAAESSSKKAQLESGALKALMRHVETGPAFQQASQAAVEVDRAQVSYSSDFEPSSSARQTSPESAGGAHSDRVLPPKAVDVLLDQECKQQRLVLKLREKARIEKTLAELELLQMQKRILRAQGDREKAASVKKKQRGLLMRLQDERAKFDGLRRQRKKDAHQRHKAAAAATTSGDQPHHSSATTCDSSSWETELSAHSAGCPTDPALESVASHDDDDDVSDSSSSTLQPIIDDDIKGNEMEMPFQVAADVGDRRGEAETNDSVVSSASNPRLRAPLSPRTTESSIRARIKLRRRHSSGSDDSINLSQTETTSDVSDVESRLLALTDQLQKRQAEAQRLKLEHRRISKEKLKAQESALLKQIEVYDKCISDLRTQLESDAAVQDSPSVNSGHLAVRPVIRQPRALIRTEEAKSPTSLRSESDSKADLDASKQSEAEEQPNLGCSSAEIRTELERLTPEEASQPVAVDTEKSLSELSADPVADEQPLLELLSDSGRADETMIVKNDSIVHEELAEEISRSILEQLVDETIDVATKCVLEKRKSASSLRQSASVLQRVSALLSNANHSGEHVKDNRSQLYLTTTFDLISPDDGQSPANSGAEQNKAFALNGQSGHCDVTSTEGRTALENKLNELRLENEWIDDDLVAAESLSSVEINRERVIQEAEELEREQRRIQEEIQRLSVESVLYMREIPNKPPPPYTPPGQALNWQRLKTPPSVEPQNIAPRSKDDIVFYCRRFAEFLIDGEPDVAIPEQLFAVDYSVPEQPAECRVNCRAFVTFIADLTRCFLVDLRKRAAFLPDYRPNVAGPPFQSRQELLDCLEQAVLVQSNQRPRLRREGQLSKWSQRKRDRIDEILVKELQAEEKLWTDFSREEHLVKRQTADAILDTLLDETAAIVRRLRI